MKIGIADNRKRSKYVLAGLLIAFFWVSFATKYWDWKNYRLEITKAIYNDGQYYKDVAAQIVKGERPDAYLHNSGLRTGFILYLAVLLKIFGYHSDFIISLINMVIISLFLILLAYLVMKRFGPNWYGASFIAAVIFIAGNQLILFWSPFILTDSLAMAVLILGMFIYLTMSHKLKYLLMGIVYAVAFHIREVTFLNFMALLVSMVMLKEPKKNIITLLLVYFVMIIPWLLYVQLQNSRLLFLDQLIFTTTFRKSGIQADTLSFGARFIANLARHYFLYITDGGPIDTHGYYSIVHTLTMYVMGLVGGVFLFIKGHKKEFYFIVASIVLTALFYGFVGEAQYMRGRVLVEYLLIYSAAIGFMFCLESIKKKSSVLKTVDSLKEVK